jgi:ApbE superfamily uncharacterized protein (UPF0280 family)
LKIFRSHFTEKESDITIISESKNAILRAKEAFYYHRNNLEKYILEHNDFLISFSPVKVKTNLKIINLMAIAANICNVGPMATVAGAFADLMLESMKVNDQNHLTPVKIALVENGGEIAVDSEKPMKIALYAGFNELNLNLGFLIKKCDCPMGIATSSATIGHALSLGQADVVTVFAKDATLADGAATAIGNLVKGKDIEASIKKGLDAVNDLDGIFGAFIYREGKIGQVGKVPQLIKIEGNTTKILKEKIEDYSPNDSEHIK